MSSFLVYLFCLALGFVFILVSAAMGHLFGAHGHVTGSGGHAEAGADSSDAPGVSMFSPIVMAAFVTAFGAFGLIFSQFDFAKSPLVSAPLSIVCAMVVAYCLVTVLGKIMRAADSSSESRVASLTGMAATVVSPLPEGGVGEIAYVQGGTRYTAPAREQNGKPIAAGSAVTITRVVGTQFYITASSAPSTDSPKNQNS
jgi:membrane protein implicated in regulation of membrane protease activity